MTDDKIEMFLKNAALLREKMAGVEADVRAQLTNPRLRLPSPSTPRRKGGAYQTQDSPRTSPEQIVRDIEQLRAQADILRDKLWRTVQTSQEARGCSREIRERAFRTRHAPVPISPLFEDASPQNR